MPTRSKSSLDDARTATPPKDLGVAVFSSVHGSYQPPLVELALLRATPITATLDSYEQQVTDSFHQ